MAVPMVMMLEIDIIDIPLIPWPEVQPPAILAPRTIKKPPAIACEAGICKTGTSTSRGMRWTEPGAADQTTREDGRTEWLTVSWFRRSRSSSTKTCRRSPHTEVEHADGGLPGQQREELGNPDKKATGDQQDLASGPGCVAAAMTPMALIKRTSITVVATDFLIARLLSHGKIARTLYSLLS